MRDVRGNVETRLRKLHAGDYDALVLAEAGLTRLGLGARNYRAIAEVADSAGHRAGCPGPGMSRRRRARLAAIAPLNHPETHHAVLAERELLRTLSGGCLAPVAAWGRVEGDRQLHLTAVVLSVDGRQRLFAEGAELPRWRKSWANAWRPISQRRESAALI